METTADGFTSMLRVSKVDSDDEWVWTALEVRSSDFRQREPTGRFWSAGTDDELSDRQSVLLFDAVPAALGGDLRDKGIQYLDRSGNCYLKAPGLLVAIEGRRATRAIRRTDSFSRTGGMLSPAGIAVVFCLLMDSNLVRRPLRDIADTAAVSLGSVQRVVQELVDNDYIGGSGRHRGDLRRVPELTQEWAIAYGDRLVPRLGVARAEPLHGTDLRHLGDVLRRSETCTVSGEIEAADIRSPQTLIAYTDDDGRSASRAARLRKDPRGPVLLRDRFWNENLLSLGSSAPPLLVAADLLSMTDPRLKNVGRTMIQRIMRAS